MKNKPGKYLKFYYECMKTGYLPENGLCKCGFGCRDIWANEYDGYWGYDGITRYSDLTYEISQETIRRDFSPLRQTMVLFMAAMNNEL